MAGVNRVILVGHLGKDPEVRHLESGRSVANFSLATSETYKNKNGEKVTNTEWHNIVIWSPLAQVAEKYLRKGSLIYVEGKLTNRSYDDKDGNKRYITEILVQSMTMLGSGGSKGSSDNSSMGNNKGVLEGESDIVNTEGVDDLPF